MDLICTASIFLKATMYIAIGSDYMRVDTMHNYIELDNESYIYCKQSGGNPLEFGKNGVLIFTPDKQKT
jgi:hypothetical protein